MEGEAIVCRDPANELLIWYLNGTLAGEEAEIVRRHLTTCAVCRAELDELSAIGRHLQEKALRLPSATFEERREGASSSPGVVSFPKVESSRSRSGRRIRSRASIAAAAVLVAALAFLWYEDRQQPGLPPREGSIATVDLGAGTPRGSDPLPRLLLGKNVREVRFSFLPPVNPEATYGVEIHEPLGGIVVRREPAPLQLDSQGRSEYSTTIDRIRAPGDYDLILREFAPRGETHEYHYPFRVSLSDRP